MELTQSQIEEINKKCPDDWDKGTQGVFVQPSGVPVHIKEHVVYMSWMTGEVSGGSCWDSSNPRYYPSDNGKPKFEALDLVLKELMPSISFLQFREIENLVKKDDTTEYEYYGNRRDFDIEYIVLSELIKKLESWT